MYLLDVAQLSSLGSLGEIFNLLEEDNEERNGTEYKGLYI